MSEYFKKKRRNERLYNKIKILKPNQTKNLTR